MKTSNSTTILEMPSSWLLHYFDEAPYSKMISALPCLQEAYLCVQTEDIRKTWYQRKLKAIILVVEKHDTLLEDWACRLMMALPEAPLVIISVEKLALDEVKLLELGIQDIWSLEELSETLLSRIMHHSIIRKQVEYQTRHLAHYDSLTGIANRTLFQDRLDHSLLHARRECHVLGLLILDLDRFRVVNEHYGHDIGDLLLKQFARRLGEIVRRSDTVARLNGNNFAVLLENVVNENMISQVAEKLCKAFSEPYFIAGHEIFCSISIGIEIASRVSYDGSLLLGHAELALRQAKQDGRNDYRFFISNMSPPDMVRASLESALHHALERQELSLQYQPQIRVSNKQFIGTEVLLRWTHETLGSISPVVFIPVLEETGLINKVGEWVLASSCRQHQEWIEKGALPSDAKLSVNLSPRQFRQRDLADRIVQILDITGMKPQLLTLEITEGVLMDNLQQGIDILGRLREIGVSIAIDDFGTGYSSLAYLKDLPIDYLKIDRVFVKDIVDDKNDAAIANSIIALAHNLGMEVIAEGVEDHNVLGVLQAFGCDHYQGFFFSRPVDPEKIPGIALQLFSDESFGFTGTTHPSMMKEK
ncbi:MAG: bifunctional diguanylate cyclase/phosphodiesterase [Oleispira antarctica]|uniref:Diguanylate cyclase/phosphodiesterase n=1 Tax=Oleispira antarctica RB-8 TaxID=698738 RepID=R4YMK3_OLEAN|nr:bifunctional diguanylate cyclase/phosphodiesterase [Oleispira antarctica]MBQ0791046.1 bifunctional diguanylate cyclase/phosphodiesterase [Oleispira antarctica]CCK74318.1 Diguanylate cyclase/phosphodiesterase [Oleispira antarctica RB-8]|tara:strand:+ start:119 stop:1888 length:1770 start_codon:yes stop_codon:yes gene_type:complete